MPKHGNISPFSNTKVAFEKLEILLLKAQEGLKVGKVTQSKLEAVETLQDSLKCMLELRLIVDEMKTENIKILWWGNDEATRAEYPSTSFESHRPG